MRILIYSDNHFCERSSIITKLGTKYTLRLENQIKSINWAEQLAVEKKCDIVICAGDFFDKPTLTSQELTALSEIKWANKPHYFLVGNHESADNDLQYSSTKVLEQIKQYPKREVISKPCCFSMKDFELAFLPYISEGQKKDLSEYLPKLTATPRLLISHNDIFGLQLGPIVSKVGFKPEDFVKYATLTINGHLHNGQKINDNLINIGDLTGKDFGENAYQYKHCVAILDTTTFGVMYAANDPEYIENPYAFNFYKLDLNSENEFNKLNNLKNNAIVSIQCPINLYQKVVEYINNCSNIVESRIIIKQELSETTSADTADLVVDHYAKFVECCRAKLENTKVLEEELTEILK